MHQAIAGSRLELMGKCGHWPQHEQHEPYNQLSIEFLLANSGNPTVSPESTPRS
jgi:2-hydroxy-6-oxonona-2,4-dienedioate hydrolase